MDEQYEIKLKSLLMREWRYTDDEEYAKNLFKIAADSPLNWGFKLHFIVIGAIYGFFWIRYIGTRYSLELGIIGQAIGILLGIFLGFFIAKKLTWQKLLTIISPKKIFSSGDIVLFLFFLSISYFSAFGKWNHNYSRRFVFYFTMSLPVYFTIFSLGSGRLSNFFDERGGLCPKFIYYKLFLVGLSISIGQFRSDVFIITSIFTTIILAFIYVIPAGLLSTILYFTGITLNKFFYNVISRFFAWKIRPHFSEVLNALEILDTPQWRQILVKIDESTTDSPTCINYSIANLNHEDWDIRFIARHTLYPCGGEIISRLKNFNDFPDINWLIKDIVQINHALFSKNTSNFICLKCLTRFTKHKEKIFKTIYGCRKCKQSKNYKFYKNDIIAVLDNQVEEEKILDHTKLTVNWFKLNSLFDFDRVEIINATGKDVEQFCIQVGNDTDEIRQPRYKQMECLVKCTLDTNTIRILENTFGEVKITYG